MPSKFNIVEFCKKIKENNCADYSKLHTAGNNPQISQKMRYAEYIRSKHQFSKTS